ncbi:MAG TPA: DUF169 domain-containing protein [Candidatus Acidoferrales bacterium]|nr:DUF169 domain-containing protein [Candidatus Acidoferrales bacterium]
MDYREVEDSLKKSLGLRTRPVSVKFQDEAPAKVAKFQGTEPSGCSFWRLAAAGKTFYTVPSDHYNCPIGSHTHNIPMPQERLHELAQTLSFVVGIGYLKMEEVPGIPRLPRTPGAAVYAPLSDTPADPDVVMISCTPRQAMIIEEAAMRAGSAAKFPILGRPTCAAIPAAILQGVVASAGCIGNRVYTGLKDDELYVAIPGRDLKRVTEEIEMIAAANAQLAEYHAARRQSLATE